MPYLVHLLGLLLGLLQGLLLATFLPHGACRPFPRPCHRKRPESIICPCSYCLGFGWSKLSGAGRNHTNKNKVVLVVGLWVNQDGSVLGSGHWGGFSPCVSHPPGARSPAKASFFLDHERGTRDQAETLKSSVACARNCYTVVFSSFNLSKQVTRPNLKSGGGESGGGGGGPGGGRFKLRRQSMSKKWRQESNAGHDKVESWQQHCVLDMHYSHFTDEKTKGEEGHSHVSKLVLKQTKKQAKECHLRSAFK